MVLEATVLCLDNSEWMRNGDYTPTRLEAQQDALNLITGAKTQSNPESTVAVVACAGKSPEVLVTLTGDLGKVLSSLHDVKIGKNLDFVAGIQVAQLVLKHRQNKNQQQRVIYFVGSPIDTDKEELVKLAKRLKKNNIAVDIVNFGEEGTNTEKLEAFITAVNNNNNSHLVTIPPGPHILSDILISSPIISEDSTSGTISTGTPSSSAPASSFAAYGGVDPNLDPELALVLKISMEEERARQEAENKKKGEGDEKSKPSEPSTPAPATPLTSKAPDNTGDVEMGELDEEAALAEAIALSMAAKSTSTSSAPTSTSQPKPTPAPTSMDIGEDDEMALAMQMSMQAEALAQGNKQDDVKVIEDPEFMNSVLMSLPGVDPNDERIKNVLASMGKPNEDKKDKDNKEKK